MMVIREMLEEEYPFLEKMLYASIHVPEGEAPYPQNIIEKPELRKYTEGFGREHDHCLVAQENGMLVGAVWVRCFPKEDPGYGFVDESIPELGMAVHEPYRGQGIGTKLIEAMISHLLSHGYGKVSLSVDGTNPAIRLYRRFGFFDVKTENGTHTMVLELNPEV
jgi:ribosomal protein S18 acetylase RimI-like enzyme